MRGGSWGVQDSTTQTAPRQPRADRGSYAATRTGLHCAQCLCRSAVVFASLRIGSVDVAAVGGGGCGDAAGSANERSRRGSLVGACLAPDLSDSVVGRIRSPG